MIKCHFRFTTLKSYLSRRFFYFVKLPVWSREDFFKKVTYILDAEKLIIILGFFQKESKIKILQ